MARPRTNNVQINIAIPGEWNKRAGKPCQNLFG